MTTKVVVRHFHEGNDADRAVRGHTGVTYATLVRIIDLNTGLPVQATPAGGQVNILKPCEIWALCNPKDVPSRKQGREICFGRLRKMFPEQCDAASWGVFRS
jgi:hypothetical protein